MHRGLGLKEPRQTKPKILSPFMSRPFPNRAAPGTATAELRMPHLSGVDRSRHLMTVPVAQHHHGAKEQQVTLLGHWVCFLLPSFKLQESSNFHSSPQVQSPQSMSPAGRNRHFPGQTIPALPPPPRPFPHSFSSEGGRKRLTFCPL